MAEAVGTFAAALSIAKLFKACLDAFDMVQAARHHEVDFNRLLVKFNIEKCRLYTWGQMMGLTTTSQLGEPRPLDSFQFRNLVIQTLQTLHELFNDSQRIKNRYGCREAAALATDSGEEAALTSPLAAAFFHFQNGPQDGRELKLGQRARWVIRDRKKFEELISQIKELVDGLQEITKSISPRTLQESAMTNRIATITNVDTLQLVSEVCEEDHPIFSQAASLKSEILSMPEARRLEIEAWLADETPLLDPEITDLENMNFPELKHHMLSLLKQRQQLKDDYYSTLIRLDDDLKSLGVTTKVEDNSMRIIALITLIYLPGTFVSTLWSTSQFDSDYSFSLGIWTSCATAIPLTATTVYWLIMRKHRHNLRDEMRRMKSRSLKLTR